MTALSAYSAFALALIAIMPAIPLTLNMWRGLRARAEAEENKAFWNPVVAAVLISFIVTMVLIDKKGVSS